MDVTRAVEENLFELLRTLGRRLGELEETASLSRFRTGLPSPMHNAVFAARLGDDEIEQALAQSSAWFAQVGRPFFWWTGDRTTPPDLGDRLERLGLTQPDHDWPGMALELDGLEPAETSADVRIVETEEDVGDWARTFCEAFEVPAWAGESWLEAARRLGFRHYPWRFWLARSAGRPVGVGISFVGAGVVGLYGIGTIPEARGQGIGTALTVAPLLAAQAEGIRHGILHSTDEGYGLYRRLGFRDSCKVGRLVGGL